MVGASKILTVSYGTFSCTLEGFDEPFNTMKAIAEYFRDLAADDRYFGAEPPQPDAEMLHRIAEREMSRRVEAKIQKNGIILRPEGSEHGAEDGAEPAPPAVIAPKVTVAAVPPPVATLPVADPSAAPPLAEAPPTTLSSVTVAPAGPAPLRADPVTESVAAKLQRIRAAVAQARSAAETEAETEAEAETDELPPGFATAADTALGMDQPVDQRISPPEDFGFALDISGPLSAEENAALSDAAAGAPAEAEEDFGQAEAEEAEETAQEVAEEAETSEDAQAALAARHRRRAERRAARLAETQAEDAAEAEAQPAPEPEAQPEPEPVTAAPAAPVEPPPPAIRARVIKLRRAGPLPAPAPARATAPEPSEAEAVLAALAAQLAPAAAEAPQPIRDETALSPEAEADLLAELAALGADLPDEDWGRLPAERDLAAAESLEAATEDDADEASLADDVRDLPEAEDLAAPVEEAQPAAQVSPAEAPEAETPVVEMAAPETPESAMHLPDLASAEEDASPAPQPEPPLVLVPSAKVGDTEADLPATLRPHAPPPLPEGDVSRLLDKADAQMAGQENRRRISAIAHLKAAVAATVAERRAKAAPAQADDTAPYRQDLTQAVRPRRPVLSPAPPEQDETTPEARHPTARPELRPAPLVLVSEQRVDRLPAEEAAKAHAVRPRRVTAALLRDQFAETEAQDEDEAPTPTPLSPEAATSFAEFALSRAPQGLAELLEAAAAYTAQVEGRPHFSPPQIMRKVSAIGAETFSREDRLRVFGTLLRQGKIAKVKRGQYAITEASRFFERSA